MKVRELMEYLNKFPGDATVMCFEPGNGEYMINTVKPAASLAMMDCATTGLIIRRVF
jgi:hypothetical protein